MDCIFCKILEGSLPAHFVYRDERVAAFMDIQPVNPGHVLVIPVQHAVGLQDISAEDTKHIMTVSQKVSLAIRASGLKCEGINLFLADGEAAMQEVFHFHMHVFPRFKGDGFGLTFSPEYFTKPPYSSLAEHAEAIKAHL
ncbi:HIT family protein [Ruficoccus sp. ZRK36]|uniref:HIT family protein n=1 Tax=Ruficoccus sp. ZRK36 TaxID=2866311 RepID=UPI001C73B74F|nr:HIT family protein [Ruficoccus sp. ZRK36]QYY36345.1 HIT family protein [Ruficoccus sp. ZRK36]